MKTQIVYFDETGDYDLYIKSSNTFIKCAVKPLAFSYGEYQLRGKGNLIIKETQLQFYLQDGFIDRLADNDIIAQRVTDGYINATAMCKAARKKINDYGRLSTTQAFLAELSSVTGIPVTGLVQTIRGGTPQLQGTWVHPQVAINLAQWLSPKFAVLVSQWVFEWMSGNIQQPKLPYHLKRYLVNMANVPYGYFSMLKSTERISIICPLWKNSISQ